MGKVWRTIRGYIWWDYARGSFHYDVMVSLILLFIFLAPLWINFHDKPARRSPHQTEVVVLPSGNGRFIYQVDASAVDGASPATIEESLQQVVEEIAGEITIERYEPQRDRHGKVQSYKVWAEK